MSLGVCLPGGGAKGAFQAGVLEALYNRGIKNYKKYMLKGINNFRICRMSRIML